MNGKTGVLNVYSNTWVLTPDYDTTEVITYGFYVWKQVGNMEFLILQR